MKTDSLFDIDRALPRPGEPDFSQFEKVLSLQVPNRPTLFEFFLNPRLLQKLTGLAIHPNLEWLDLQLVRLKAFQRAGYDYLTVLLPGFNFETGDIKQGASISQNEGAVIHDRASFDQYVWPDPEQTRLDLFEALASYLPTGMRLIPYGPCGVLENTISLVGYENLCLMILDDPTLAADVFAEIGTRLNGYYQLVANYDFVGAVISNDDWGFKTQTMFSPRHMRQFVFPWHTEIVNTIHTAGKPAILHSCGFFDDIITDIIEKMGYDARHSYEDTIKPVETAYEALYQQIAILGGIDVDFICQAEPQSVYERAKAMLERSMKRGAYALGSGNSVPDYVPDDSYFAMIRAALELR